ncbi:hypothetical protein VTN77DRAFT_2663 [Rasamsonia byssochlamydoides]|uniref:uncharacterized protein n=1 Tax=Rasamsonia byssochlamydoides TaxID=89139 RepID=UPI003742EF8C
MKILCLHGRGSNNEIFQVQTASLRSDLDDFTFEFVQGTDLHTEGNWSLYTTMFSNLPQYGYYNPLVPSSIIEAEDHLLEFIKEEASSSSSAAAGYFDGVLGYSGGAAFAAQAFIRHKLQNPPDCPPLFRFAVFINGGTPLKAFSINDVSEVNKQDGSWDSSSSAAEEQLNRELVANFLRPSNLRARKGENLADAEAAIASRKKEIDKLRTGVLADGRAFIAAGGEAEVGVTRYDSERDGTLIDIPTLHVRCPHEEDPNNGLNLLKLCEPSLAREYHHPFGHDFPRGHVEMKKIAQLVRETAESV